ncbi:unnamed protein product [Agarophyton chilense]
MAGRQRSNRHKSEPHDASSDHSTVEGRAAQPNDKRTNAVTTPRTSSVLPHRKPTSSEHIPIPRRPVLLMNGGNNHRRGYFSGFHSALLPRGSASSTAPSQSRGPVEASSHITPAEDTWPSYDELVWLNPRQHAAILRRAPWFHPTAVFDEELVASYADGNACLPGELLALITTSWEWRRRVAVPIHAILRRRRQSAEEAHYTFVRIGYSRINRANFQYPIPDEFGFDLRMYRTQGEIGYCDRLAA